MLEVVIAWIDIRAPGQGRGQARAPGQGRAQGQVEARVLIKWLGLVHVREVSC